MEKVKLMCSYGGRIQQRSHDLQLSYFGGHTKILTVDRNINYSNLLSKLHDLCEHSFELQVKYKLPGQDLEALVSIFDDDDLNHMMFEYDLLRQASIKPARFRLFVFFQATAKPITAKSLNPDFLFGFDKEYSFDYDAAVDPWKIPENLDTVASLPNVIIENGAPNYNSGVYAAPLGYRVPANAGGYFQAGLYDMYAECGGK